MADKKTYVLITGCSPGGIGHSLVKEFHRQGCHVIATVRNTDMIKDLEAPGISVVPLEVTDSRSIAECKEKVAELTGGRLDILVNNAGRTHTIPALDIEIDDVRQTYEVNVFAPMMIVQAFAPLLIEARGLILNISSTSTLVPYIFGAVYSSTKGAINVWSRALRLELKPFNVRVMTAITGTVRSNIASRTHRSLPENSLYMPVNDFFQRRLTFSQRTATVPTETYARKLVTAALKGEGYFGGLIGASPDYFYAGGMSTRVWILSCLPRWVNETVIGIFFGIGNLTRRIQGARAKSS
ncbi:1-acylglycerone phosphate reductase [Fusarium austroafricanum]|uniref:1-acylglycerone phosphate reductase n=1 Tax=Fusarium austroafricanum TaxID=2364996 RepID=A0A8H4KVL6_9HYPO|nr:1-acylglycerone phosphate reductase [Fusarium austroafricanum]